jgi:hypothetical protein
MQVAAMADYEPRMLLKTIRSAPQRKYSEVLWPGMAIAGVAG